MKTFLKPTKVTLWIFGVLLLVVYVPVVLINMYSMLPIGYIAIPFLVTFFLLFSWFDSMGVPVGYYGDFFGLPNPNVLGYVLVIGSQLIVIYLISALVAWIWYRFKSSENY